MAHIPLKFIVFLGEKKSSSSSEYTAGEGMREDDKAMTSETLENMGSWQSMGLTLRRGLQRRCCEDQRTIQDPHAPTEFFNS